MNLGTLDGAAEVAMNGVWIPAEAWQSISLDIEPGTRTITSLGGEYEKPSGTYTTSMFTGILNLPSMDYLKNIVPTLYNAPTGGTQTTGNVIIGSGQCLAADGVPVVIHHTCFDTDDNDITLPNARIVFAANGELNDTDPLTVEVRAYGLPDAEGVRVRFGTGDLTQPSRWDAATGTTVPVTSAQLTGAAERSPLNAILRKRGINMLQITTKKQENQKVKIDDFVYEVRKPGAGESYFLSQAKRRLDTLEKIVKKSDEEQAEQEQLTTKFLGVCISFFITEDEAAKSHLDTLGVEVLFEDVIAPVFEAMNEQAA